MSLSEHYVVIVVALNTQLNFTILLYTYFSIFQKGFQESFAGISF